MRKTFILLSCLLIVLWLVVYYFIHELDCAFDARPTCGLPMPWAMRGDEFVAFVLAPGVVLIGLIFGAWRAGPRP